MAQFVYLYNLCVKRKQTSRYIKLSQPYPKTMEIFTRNNDTKNIRKSCWFVRNC